MNKLDNNAKTDHLPGVVHQEKLVMLLQQSHMAAYMSVIIAAILVGILWQSQQHSHLLVWMAGIVVTAAARFYLYASYSRNPPEIDENSPRETAYFAATLIYFAWWSFGSLWIMPKDSFAEQIIVLYFMIGLAGSAVAVFSASWALQISAISLLLLPIVSWFYAQGSLQTAGMATAGLMFLLSAMRSARVLAGTINTSLSLKHRLIAANAVAERLARIDELTDLYNRRAFYEYSRLQTAQAQRTGNPLSLILLDIDHFKGVNDTYGHAVGDEVLRHVSDMLRASVRESDICGRIGGEEFALLLPGTSAEKAQVVAEALRRSLYESPFNFSDGEAIVHASFGVAAVHGEFSDALRQADAALYSAKSAGRNRVEVCDNITPIRTPGGEHNRR
ncbi:GGDEF domain-containing protein [Halioglobus maricola]|uniref:diguanylate cyclase n=1 Tax=Halioglobus maricola TaxID=2601894 RepID=A0A5P9NI11_9GAMM|nr:GGDEF domain-containing protein [Halioglobus maricola]QFU75432.1 GGDEF domain-containing protein [Halioglobus maricola]